MATGQRTKSKLKNRNKYKRSLALQTRRKKAKRRAWHKRGLNRSRTRRSGR